ncbi:MAG: sodium:solute symporter [Bacteroidales bacterium]|nr:sodium:solute symporter [Bacteroidales bacterium]MCF8391308.1 sodium:solute symporter [Bacteroidales bacterium]
MKSLHLLDYAVIILSLIVSLYIGFYFSKGQKSTKKYFAAEGKIPAWAIGMSILATLVSSVTFLAYPGEGYSGNWIRLVQGLMVPIVLVFIIWGVVPLYRNVIGISAYEYFEKRFGYFARIYASLGFILAHFSKMGTVLYLLGLAIASLLGVNTITLIWILGGMIILITLLGGIEAVIWLDVIQGFLLIVGGLISLIVIMYSAKGGPSAIWETAKENDHIGFGPFDLEFVNLTFWVMAINGVFYAIQKYGTDQTIVQRYLTAKSNKDAIKASLIGVLLSVPVWALFMFIGTALFSYYKLNSGSELPDGIRPDAIFPLFIMQELPIGITGLVISALIASAISSLDSDLNCLSAVLTEDFYGRIKKNASDNQKLFFGKIMVVVSGILAVVVATVYLKIGGKGALGIIFSLYAIFSGGIAGMFLLGLFSKRTNKKGLYIGILACVTFTAYAALTTTKIGDRLILDLGTWNFKQHNYMLGVYSHFILFIVGYVASLFFGKTKADESLTYYGWSKSKRQMNLN